MPNEPVTGVPADLGVEGAGAPQPSPDPVVAAQQGAGEIQPPQIQRPQAPPPQVQAAQVQAPQAPAPQAQETEDALPLLMEYVDPAYKKQLEERSSGKMSMGEAFALAGLAGVNQNVFAQVIGNRNMGIRQAREALDNIHMASAGAKQDYKVAMARAGAKGGEEAMKQHWQARREQAKVMVQEAANANVAIEPPPPMDDDAAWQQWFYGAQRKMEAKTGAADEQDRITSIADKLLPPLIKLAEAGGDPADVGEAAQQLLATFGVTPDEMRAFDGVVKSAMSIAGAKRAEAIKSVQEANIRMQVSLDKLTMQRETLALSEARLKQGDVNNFLNHGRLLDSAARLLQQEIRQVQMIAGYYRENGKDEEANTMDKTAMEIQGQLGNTMLQLQQVQEEVNRRIGREDPGIAIQQSFLGRAQGLSMKLGIPRDQYEQDPMRVVDWLNANSSDPLAQSFWQGVVGDLMIARPENERDLIRAYVSRSANSLRTTGSLDALDDFMPAPEPVAPAAPPPAGSTP